MGDLSAAEERIYAEREDARTIAGGLRKETTPRHERFDGATSIWTEWFSSYNANVLVPYALAKAPPRPPPRANGAGSSEGESTGPEWVFNPAGSLQLLQEYVEINAVTRPIIDQWHKDTLRYQQQTLRFDPASGRIRVPSREDADAFHEFRYRRYVELFETKFNEAPKMRTRYDAYTREGFRETLASLAMTLRELKAHLPDLTWDKVNQKAFDVMTSVWRSIPALKQSRDAGFHQLKDIVVLRQAHEDHLDEIAAEVERYEDIVRKDEIRMAEALLTAAQHFAELTGASAPATGGGRQHGTITQEPVITWTMAMVYGRRVRAQLVVVKDTHLIRPFSAQPCTSTTPLVAVAAVEAAEAQAAVSVEVMAVDAAMEPHLEADEDRAGTLVSDITPEHAAKWLEARNTALRGGLDTRDHMAVAWETVLQQAVRRFEPTARLTWVDYTHLDLTRVFAAAVQSVYDTGCDYSGVHRRVVDRMKPGEVHATLQSMSMQGIGGKMEMQRLVGRISYVINPDTDWERKFEWPSFAILAGEHLPVVIFRIELQPDDVGADAAVQPEQQNDEASEAELPELVADSDDEEDFVPCWVEDVPGHVANVIASCFTLRASPMDADSDSDEELPGLIESAYVWLYYADCKAVPLIRDICLRHTYFGHAVTTA
eukprot:jgi/Tetstr1/457964/TSEL_044477.t1